MDLLKNLRVELQAEAKARWMMARDLGGDNQLIASMVIESMANALARAIRSTPKTQSKEAKIVEDQDGPWINLSDHQELQERFKNLAAEHMALKAKAKEARK
jgi:uncharacterized protein YjaZ